MQVEATGSLPLTQPYRTTSGISISFRRGDIMQPLDFFSGAGWFSDAPAFREVYRSYSRLWLPIPFVSIRIGSWGWYFGPKAFGVDSDAYKRFLATPDVYVGSVAIMLFSWRMTRNIGG